MRRAVASATRAFVACAISYMVAFSLLPTTAFAIDEGAGTADGSPADLESAQASVSVSNTGDAAICEGSQFGLSEFSRAQKGTNRPIDGTYYGYSYLVGSEAGAFVQVIATSEYVVAYIPSAAAENAGFAEGDASSEAEMRECLCALDEGQRAGSIALSSIDRWLFTAECTIDVDAARFSFDQEIGDSVYALVAGADGSDLTDSENPNYLKPAFADFARLQTASSIQIADTPSPMESAIVFLTTLDWSPLWITLKTTGVAIVFIFALGLAAAYFCLHISQKAKSIADSLFTIPMVLPPTVCGFVLLYPCGSNTAFGRFFIDIGFPLIFSWPATVIAAVVVAFPLMYRSALGAFESLDPNMLDAARTLGWSNAKIFIRLMLPLSWSSIAAGTVLAFARALGEFGATLFLASNYLGVTRTIPIAIYFEWMNGNDGVAWFWTAIIIAFSFVVILLINLWSTRTTKYRRKEGADR